jgi:hypothetical protein
MRFEYREVGRVNDSTFALAAINVICRRTPRSALAILKVTLQKQVHVIVSINRKSKLGVFFDV